MRYEQRTEAAKAWRRDRSRVVQELRFIQWEIEDVILAELAEKYQDAELQGWGDGPVDLIIDKDSIRELFAEAATRLLTDGSPGA